MAKKEKTNLKKAKKKVLAAERKLAKADRAFVNSIKKEIEDGYTINVERKIRSKVDKIAKQTLDTADSLDDAVKALAAETIVDASKIGVSKAEALAVIGRTDTITQFKKKRNKIIAKKVSLKKFSTQLRPSLGEYRKDLLRHLRSGIVNGEGVNKLARRLFNIDKITAPIPDYIKQIERAMRRAVVSGRPQDYATFRRVLNKHRGYIDKLTRRGEPGFQHLGIRRDTQRFIRDIAKAVDENTVDNILNKWAEGKLNYIQKRVARTATSDAYHAYIGKYAEEADHIIGISVKLSPSHPEFDICDELAGDYFFDDVGKDGVPLPTHHPNCICFTEYIFSEDFLNNPEEFKEE
jgi:hypothetical protein